MPRELRILSLTSVLIVAGAVGAPGLDRSQCHVVPAHHTVEITEAGKVENPAGIAGGPSQEGCQIAYVVDFISPGRALASFVPDREFVKETIPGLNCRKECGGIGYLPLRAGISLYQCDRPRDCAADKFTKVGSFGVVYMPLVGDTPRCGPVVIAGGSIPKAGPASGVRLVIAPNIEFRTGDQCIEAPLPVLPPDLTFNASGSAGYRIAEPVDGGGRPIAKPVDGSG